MYNDLSLFPTKVENTIRWRYSQDEDGNGVRESNARVVRWTDGSMSLYLGGEIFDITRQPLQGEFSHLFVRQGWEKLANNYVDRGFWGDILALFFKIMFSIGHNTFTYVCLNYSAL